MEVAIGGHLKPKILTIDRAQEMVPLKDLVKQDSIEEAAEGKAQEITRPWKAPTSSGSCHCSSPVEGGGSPAVNRRTGCEVAQEPIFLCWVKRDCDKLTCVNKF
jgi:hypothetical protein